MWTAASTGAKTPIPCPGRKRQISEDRFDTLAKRRITTATPVRPYSGVVLKQPERCRHGATPAELGGGGLARVAYGVPHTGEQAREGNKQPHPGDPGLALAKLPRRA
jgi:hypothetical protein